MFYKLFPDLIKAGMVYVVDAPLYGTYIKDKFVPIYTEEDREKYRSAIIHRYKGVGVA